MKKVILTAILAVFCIGMYAQKGSSRSSKNNEKMWYTRDGLSINSFVGDGGGTGCKIGYDITFGFQKGLGDVENLYWGMEFGLGTRGFKYEEVDSDDEYDYAYTFKNTQNMLTHTIHYSPFTVGYKYALNDKIKLDAHLGVFASVDYAGKMKWEEYSQERGSQNNSISLGNIKDEMGYDWHRFDVGMKLGVGVWYDCYNLDFTWKRGFVEAIKDGEAFSSNYMIRVGMAF